MEKLVSQSGMSTPAVGLRRYSTLFFILAIVCIQVSCLYRVVAVPTDTSLEPCAKTNVFREYDLTVAVNAAPGVLTGQTGQRRSMTRTNHPHVSLPSGFRPLAKKASGGSAAVKNTNTTEWPLVPVTRNRKTTQSSAAAMHRSETGQEAARELLHRFFSPRLCLEERLLLSRWRKSMRNEAARKSQYKHVVAAGTEARELHQMDNESKRQEIGRTAGTWSRGLSASDVTKDLGGLPLQEQQAMLLQHRRMEEEALTRRWERRTQQVRQQWKEVVRKRTRSQPRQESHQLGRMRVVSPANELSAEKMYTSLFSGRKGTVPTVLLGLPRQTVREGDPGVVDDFSGGIEGAEEDMEEFAERSLEQQTRKTYVRYTGGYVSAYACTMIGRRPTDEDALVVNVTSRTNPNACFEAVFDGHGGHQAAQFAAKNAARFFGHLETFDAQSITDACLSLDAAILRSPGIGRSGATGVLVFIERILEPEEVTVVGREIVPENDLTFKTAAELICQDEAKRGRRTASLSACPPRPSRRKIKLGVGENRFRLTVANIGDSRALLIHENGKYTRLSRDHKPSVAAEAQRIVNAGGFIDYTDTFRVNGVMSLSRAFGDADMKQNPHQPLDKQLITAVPDVRSFMAKTSDVLLIACDGLYEPREMTPQYVARFIHTELRRDSRPERALFRILDAAFDFNSGDNISGILTFFRERRALKEFKRTAIVSGKSELHDV